MRTERLDSGSRMQRLPDTEVEVELHPGLLLVQLVRKRDVDYASLDDGPYALPSAQVVEQSSVFLRREIQHSDAVVQFGRDLEDLRRVLVGCAATPIG